MCLEKELNSPAQKVESPTFDRLKEHEGVLYGSNGCQNRVLRLKSHLGTTHKDMSHSDTQGATCDAR